MADNPWGLGEGIGKTTWEDWGKGGETGAVLPENSTPGAPSWAGPAGDLPAGPARWPEPGSGAVLPSSYRPAAPSWAGPAGGGPGPGAWPERGEGAYLPPGFRGASSAPEGTTDSQPAVDRDPREMLRMLMEGRGQRRMRGQQQAWPEPGQGSVRPRPAWGRGGMQRRQQQTPVEAPPGDIPPWLTWFIQNYMQR